MLVLDGTLGENFPTWTTAGRPASPVAGQTGFNTTLSTIEVYNGTNWLSSDGIWTTATRPTGVAGLKGYNTTLNIVEVYNGTAWTNASLPVAGTSGNVLTSDGTNWASTVLSATPAGTIITYGGTTAPTGYLLCPTSATTVSRTTYATLFAAIGTTWGVGDGSTTFNIPAFTADFAHVQASANVGTTTAGVVIAHTHTTASGAPGNTVTIASPGTNLLNAASNTGSYGTGTNNLAAGARVLFCIKY